MKLFGNQNHGNAKTKLSLALCTVVAFSAATMLADDDKDKGAPAGDSGKATGKSSQLSRTDENFIKDACRGGQMEIQMGKLGLQKGQSQELKTFAQRLIDDHTKANTELKQLAVSKGVKLPEPEEIAESNEKDRSRVRDILSGEYKEHAAMKKLEGLSGTDFDREFAKIAVNDHEKDIKEFEKTSQKADDSDVKAFAANTLPTLREHLQQAKTLQASVGK